MRSSIRTKEKTRQNPLLPASLMREPDPVDVMRRLEEGPSFTLLDPRLGFTDPVEVDRSPIREAREAGAEVQKSALEEAVERARQDQRRAGIQTLLNLAGPQVFEAITGAGTNTRLEEALDLQRRAEERARQMQDEAGLQIAGLDAETRLQNAQSRVEEGIQNQEQENAATQQQYGALSDFVGQANAYAGNLLDAELKELEIAQKRAEAARGDLDLTPSEFVDAVYKRPEILDTDAWYRYGRRLGYTNADINQIRETAQEAQIGTQNVNELDREIQAMTKTIQEGRPVLDNNNRPVLDIDGNQIREPVSVSEAQRIREQQGRLQQAMRARASNFFEDVYANDGVVTPDEALEGMKYLGSLRNQGITSLSIAGQRLPVQDLMDVMTVTLQRERRAEARRERSRTDRSPLLDLADEIDGGGPE